MTKTADLFERKAFDDLKLAGLQIESRPRTVIDQFVTIEGVRFDADDLYETLMAVDNDQVVVQYDRAKLDLLKRLGVLASEGNSRWCSPATLGPNGEEFLEMLREHRKE